MRQASAGASVVNAVSSSVNIRDSYGYAPRRERYIERRGYGDGGGIGIRAPGVSVGIGTDRY